MESSSSQQSVTLLIQGQLPCQTLELQSTMPAALDGHLTAGSFYVFRAEVNAVLQQLSVRVRVALFGRVFFMLLLCGFSIYVVFRYTRDSSFAEGSTAFIALPGISLFLFVFIWSYAARQTIAFTARLRDVCDRTSTAQVSFHLRNAVYLQRAYASPRRIIGVGPVIEVSLGGSHAAAEATLVQAVTGEPVVGSSIATAAQAMPVVQATSVAVPQMATFVVTVPAGVSAGTPIQVTAPDGQRLQVVVPQGVPPEGAFHAQYMPSPPLAVPVATASEAEVTA